ncbi:MAG: hypothetical protein PHY73_00100 [Candidatus Omnitrophica bacterium]|nr:hypothetical protein [Candidatus Omnitrophota bacterium]
MKNKIFKGQIAIEYLLLLTICALVAFLGFKTFFGEDGQVRDAATNYFVKVQNAIVGDPVDGTALSSVIPQSEWELCEGLSYDECGILPLCLWAWGFAFDDGGHCKIDGSYAGLCMHKDYASCGSGFEVACWPCDRFLGCCDTVPDPDVPNGKCYFCSGMPILNIP